MQIWQDIPDVWGEGALFAFSGIDGQTNTASDFVLTAESKKYSWLVQLPARKVLTIHAPSNRCEIVTGDVVKSGDITVTFSEWHTITGHVPIEVDISLREENSGCVYNNAVLGDEANTLVLLRRDHRFALAYGKDPDEATRRAETGMLCDIDRLISARMGFLSHVPKLQNNRLQKLLYKMYSVMKVNSLAPEGVISVPWSTPDRVPHKVMWLWDSVFHSFAMNRVNPELAWQYLYAVIERQQPDGMIPHMMYYDGRTSQITQPPVLAWGVLENYKYLNDRQRLQSLVVPLERYLEWNINHRDKNGNMLFEWYIEGNPLCRSGESGMDNSPRFDDAEHLDAVDFSVFMANDAACLADMAGMVGESQKAEKWRNIAREISTKIQSLLWNDELGFYCDRRMDGKLSPVQAVSGFLPLLLDDMPGNRVDALINAMKDPSRFGSQCPLPSVAVCETTWSTDMWRGATWINYNYMIAKGLQKQGRCDEALQLVGTTVEIVKKYYDRFGVTFEYYDAKDKVPPSLCDRKGKVQPPYNIRKKIDAIRDYNWTAALVAILILDYNTELCR